MRLVKSAFFAFARNRIFPAIVFSVMSFFLVSFFSLLVFSSLISWSACQHFSHIGKFDGQVNFVGNGFLVVASCSQACHNIGRCFCSGVLPAVFRASPGKHFSGLVVFSASHAV